MAVIPFTFRDTNDFSILKVTYHAENQTFGIVYNYTKPKQRCLMATFTLSLKETSPEGEVKYTPWLITSPFPQAKFALPLAPYLVSPGIRVELAHHNSDVPVTGKNAAQCVLRVHFTRNSGVANFPYVGVGEPRDIAELVGQGPKMTAICLYRRALEFLGPKRRTQRTMDVITFLYRNKTKEYFGDIFLNQGGIMRPYLKDNTGDPNCPITNRLEGLFFSASVSARQLPSPYGPRRFLVPFIALLENMESPQFYFADFYCLDKDRSVHHVNLVLCEKDTKAYEMCEEYLLALPSENPFLKRVGDHSYLVNSHIRVEVIYTKEIDMVRMCRDMDAEMETVQSYGTSDQRGILKSPKCIKCNKASFEKWDAVEYE